MDEKEIEEMAKVVCDYVKSENMSSVKILANVNPELLYATHNTGVAEALHKAGYRKIEPYITEEMIVRADDDDNTKIEKLTKERNFWRGQAHKHFKDMGEVRKETAREIVELMLTEYECYIPADIVKEIAQKYDLEETKNG